MSRPRAWLQVLAVAALLVLLGACAREFPNHALATYEADNGYRLTRAAPEPDEDVLLILSFSGGGMRATAFAMGVLEALEAATYERNGQTRSLLDEADLISSVSGGSVTAAAYGLFGRDAFQRLEENFLYEDIMSELIWTGLNPVTWVRLASPNFSRIDALVELFDRRLLSGATYAAMSDRLRPYVVLNAADMSSGDVFSFTQEDFDLICSDLSRFSLARATAASAAFPIALTPVTLKNFSGESGCGAEFPSAKWRWVDNAIRGPQFSLERYRWAKRNVALRHTPEADRDPRYIHLLDGGIADNLGLETPWRLLHTVSAEGSLLARINNGDYSRVALIVVNARSDADRSLDGDGGTPGIISMASAVASVPIDRVTSDRQQSIRRFLNDLSQQKTSLLACRKAVADACNATLDQRLGFEDTEFYTIDVDFDLAEDVAVRRRLKNIPTTWTLEKGDVDLLREQAGVLLNGSLFFQRLMDNLRGGG